MKIVKSHDDTTFFLLAFVKITCEVWIWKGEGWIDLYISHDLDRKKRWARILDDDRLMMQEKWLKLLS